VEPEGQTNRLVIATSELSRSVAELLLGNRRLARAIARRNDTLLHREWIVHGLQFADRPFRGQKHSSTKDFVIVESASEGAPTDNIERAQLRMGQSMVLLRVGLGEDRSQWQGAIAFQDHIVPLDEIQLVGPGLPLITRNIDSEYFANDDELHSVRWSRLLGAIGVDALRRLRQLRVLLIGAGRNGSLMAESLVRLGIAQLVMVDPDYIGPENLDGTFGSTEDRVGKSKVESLLLHLHPIQTNCQLVGLPMDGISPSIVDRAAACDLIVTCVDSDPPRLAAAKLANEFLRVHLDVGSIVRHLPNQADGQLEIAADIRLLLPGSCVSCVGGLRDLKAAETSIRTPISQAATPLGKGISLIHSDEKFQLSLKTGSLIGLNAIACGTATQLLLDLLTGNLSGSFWQRILLQPGQSPRFEGANVVGSETCNVCQ
jgi:ThiF family